jgi:hypothetical protein
MTNDRLQIRSVTMFLLAFAIFVSLEPGAGKSQSTSASKPGSEATAPGKVELYAAVGAELTQYDVDVDGATLVKRGSLTLPANVQEAALHPSRRYLYIAWSNGGPSNLPPNTVAKGDQHGLTAFQIDPASGALTPYGKPASLPSRPIHTTTDISGTHVLTAYNDPSGLTVHRINPDGTIGSLVEQPSALDVGIYGHQVRVGGENSIAVFAINQETGEPTRIQNMDTHGIHVRTFALDPSGRILIAGNMMEMAVREKDFVKIVPASLAIFRIHADGKLEFVRKYDLKVGNRNLFWMGLVPLP